MVGPFSQIQDQINYFFPPETHPYRVLEQAIRDNLRNTDAVLDIGCGRTAPNLRTLVAHADKLYGIDLVEFDVEQKGFTLLNESITELKSFKENSIDLCYSRSVMEHVEDTDSAYAEVGRVLKPGGKYIFLTPNRFDYASIIATIVPNRFHGRIVKATEGRDEVDTFPTHYQSNSFGKIRKLADANGLEIQHLERLGQYPSYLSFNRPLFWTGCLYEKLIDNAPGMEVLKGWIFCILKKR